jgi:hypothetical protein
MISAARGRNVIRTSELLQAGVVQDETKLRAGEIRDADVALRSRDRRM